ncbi:potassium/sodium hyperpolarization-activated cyclic nucleotide-gated channel 3-like isoform X2 [Convolutriloba macropyga]|uniref:potassium/sodium hyperpolarization-activated cyclic nucleotide-gated channel 3-like isoform X2 n=1 Tax=Convolutriloba macropyga TaxID=536237 RepID=UPI003F5267B4
MKSKISEQGSCDLENGAIPVVGQANNNTTATGAGAKKGGQPRRYFTLDSVKSVVVSCTHKVVELLQFLIYPALNRFTIRIFGSKKAVKRERERCMQEAPWIIHPFSVFRIMWDFMMLLLLISNLVMLPIAIAFFDDRYTNDTWFTFNLINDFVFISDLVLNFRTGIPTNNCTTQIILRPRAILTKYLKSWFATDLISSLPFDMILKLYDKSGNRSATYASASRTLKILRLAKLLTLLKLLRVTRLLRYASQWEEVTFEVSEIIEILNLASIAVRVLNVIFTMLLIGHWNGCFMFLFPRLAQFPDDCWVSRENITTVSWQQQYSWSLFRAMSHMLGIGYGQRAPANMMDLWLVMVSMLSGATCYALFIGQATNIIQQLNSSRRQYSEKMKQIEQYMTHRKLPPDLQVRVHQYYEYKYKGKMFNEQDILDELNDCLREEVLNYNCRDLVRVVPFFKGADPLFVSAVVAKLKFEVYQPGDYVITEGSIGTKMYFIQTGTLDVITREGSVVAQLTDGAYFGEICLLAKLKRTASVKADTFCNLYSLEYSDFHSVLGEFEEMRNTIEQVARDRLKKIGRGNDTEFKRDRKMSHFGRGMQTDLEEVSQKLDILLKYHQIQQQPTSSNYPAPPPGPPPPLTNVPPIQTQFPNVCLNSDQFSKSGSDHNLQQHSKLPKSTTTESVLKEETESSENNYDSNLIQIPSENDGNQNEQFLELETPETSPLTIKPKPSIFSPSKLAARFSPQLSSKIVNSQNPPSSWKTPHKKRASQPVNPFNPQQYDNALIISNPIMGSFTQPTDPLNPFNPRLRSQSTFGSPIGHFSHSRTSSDEFDFKAEDLLRNNDVTTSDV